MSIDDLMSTREVARDLGVTHQHVARLVRNRKLRPAYQLYGRSGALFFDPAEVARFKTERAGAHKSK